MSDVRQDFMEATYPKADAPAMVPSERYCYVCFGPGDRLVAGRDGSDTAIYDCAECRNAGKSA